MIVIILLFVLLVFCFYFEIFVEISAYSAYLFFVPWLCLVANHRKRTVTEGAMEVITAGLQAHLGSEAVQIRAFQALQNIFLYGNC